MHRQKQSHGVLPTTSHHVCGENCEYITCMDAQRCTRSWALHYCTDECSQSQNPQTCRLTGKYIPHWGKCRGRNKAVLASRLENKSRINLRKFVQGAVSRYIGKRGELGHIPISRKIVPFPSHSLQDTQRLDPIIIAFLRSNHPNGPDPNTAHRFCHQSNQWRRDFIDVVIYILMGICKSGFRERYPQIIGKVKTLEIPSKRVIFRNKLEQVTHIGDYIESSWKYLHNSQASICQTGVYNIFIHSVICMNNMVNGRKNKMGHNIFPQIPICSSCCKLDHIVKYNWGCIGIGPQSYKSLSKAFKLTYTHLHEYPVRK